MCVAIIGTVAEVGDKYALVEYHGSRVKANCGLMKVEKGDRVLIHAGCIIQKVSEEDDIIMQEILSEMS